jgi:hypothetical protein
MLARACGGAIALLLVLSGCDKLRAFPGFEPARAVPPPAPPALALGPWLLEPRQGQVTVAWTTREPSVGRVWYGARDPDRLATEGSTSTDHRVVLPSLQPSTQYHYRVEGGSDVHWFSSAPAQGAEGPIHVVVYGGNHTNSGDHALVLRAAAAERPQLALHTGNMVSNAREEQLWRIWFQEERDLLAHVPILAASGDREITDQGAAYTRFFQRRGMPAYGALDYGPVHIAVLDSSEIAAGATPQKGAISEAQKAWLEEDLRRVPEDRHVWVVVHDGPWVHAKDERMGSNEAVRAAILAAHKAHPVEVVFSGHRRFYERGDIDGIRYLVLGGGGAPLEDPDSDGPGVQSAAAALSFAAVDVCGCHATGRVKDITGKVIDSFILADCGVPCSAPGAPVVAATPVAPAPQESSPGRKRSRRRRGGTLDGKKPAAENRSR